MAKILIGVATVSPDRRFLETLPNFFRDAGRHHQIDSMWIWNKPLVDAQNEMAERVLEMGYDYLLTIEDDHHGFSADMLEACLKADTHVCGISYRSRHLPFMMLPMGKLRGYDPHGIGLYDTIKETSGYHKCDLICFGFTLIRSDVFRILDRPFFRLNLDSHIGFGARATDIDFSRRLLSHGIQPIGCFDHILAHRDIEESVYQELKVSGLIEKQSIFNSIMRIHKKNKEKV